MCSAAGQHELHELSRWVTPHCLEMQAVSYFITFEILVPDHAFMPNVLDLCSTGWKPEAVQHALSICTDGPVVQMQSWLCPFAGSIFNLTPRLHVSSLAVALIVISCCTLGTNIYGTQVLYVQQQIQDLEAGVGFTLAWRTIKVSLVNDGALLAASAWLHLAYYTVTISKSNARVA